MNWYRKHQKELEYLDKHLKGGFDPHDYDSEAGEYAAAYDPKFYNNLANLSYDTEKMESYEIGELWISQATPAQLRDFEESVADMEYNSFGHDEPAYVHLDSCGLTDLGWFIHFTEDAFDIERKGFEFGHEETRGLGLTTWKSEDARKSCPGYNFAFELGSRDAEFAASKGKYGKEAVIFWGKGVRCYHSGDEEYQTIVWGPSIRSDMVFAVYQDDGDWYVPLANGREVRLDDSSISNVGRWVSNNYKMINQVENKSKGAA